MRAPGSVATLLETVASWGRYGAALRGLIVTAATITIVTTAAIDDARGLAVFLVAGATVLTIARPDSPAAFVLIALLLAQWYVGVSPALPQWSIVPALSVLVIHGAAARASVVPLRAEVDRAATRRWLLNTGIVAGLTATLWALTLGFDQVAGTGAVALSVTALGFVVALFVVLFLRDGEHDDESQAPSTT